MKKLSSLEDEIDKVYEKKLMMSEQYIADLNHKYQVIFNGKVMGAR